MMANTAQMENSSNPGISGSQGNRRGSVAKNEETKRSCDSSDTITINDYLPPEIIIKIFHYLGFYDILAARLCCTRWLDIFNYPEFASKRIFKIRGGLVDSEHPAGNVIFASKIENLYLEKFYFDGTFKQIGPNLNFIEMQSNFLQRHLLTFTHFTNLQSIKVCCCSHYDRFPKDVEFLPSGDLSQLKELELTENDLRVDKYFLRCSLHADFLKKLTLRVSNELEVEVLKILDKQAETLKLLDLHFSVGGYLDVREWKRIASKLSLNQLGLRNGFSRDIVVEMIKKQKSLRSLKLERLNMNDQHLTLIVQELPQLEKLFLISCGYVTDIGMGQLTKLPKLTVLGLGCSLKITSDGIRSIVGQKAGTRLQELHMKVLPRPDDDAICCCAQNLKHLRVLDLRCCDRAITDKSVNEIFEYQKDLRHLRLNESKLLTDFGILGHCSIRKLEKLESLSLRDCYELSDKTLCGISAPHLKFVDVRGCLRMTSRGFSALVKNCPTIEEVAFSYSKEMNDEVVDVLTRGLSRLRTLTIVRGSTALKQGTTNWKRKDFHHGTQEVILTRRT